MITNKTAPVSDNTSTKTLKVSKRQILANALLAGEHVTGLHIINDYRITSYRDAILILRKQRGMDITTVMDKHIDGKHGRYFMTPQAIKAYNTSIEVTT